MSERLSVLHLDGGRVWAGGQNQVRLLMAELAKHGVSQLCLCPRRSALEQRLQAQALPVQGVAWHGGFDPRGMLAVVRQARGRGLIHCHDAHALQVALLPARLMGVPLVASRRMHYPVSARKWNRAALVIAISKTVEQSLLRSGVTRERVCRIPSGIDVEEVQALPRLRLGLRARLGVRPSEFLVGNIGHLYSFKGQRVMAPAAARLPDVRWVIAGEGPERAALEAAIELNGVASRVHLLGRLQDARRILGELDLFAFCSPREPLGTSLLDAMAAGVPAVAADAAGAAEILEPVHRVTGSSLYPPGDAAALASLVGRLAADAGQRRRMVEAQRERLEEFRIERTAAQILELYGEVAGG
ncbi:MAG: glycosyltransferase family 4 protein [Gemmatimonadetes bacterium]|nr:glycosyltransferase family 4 protein [Gemmatimonadota bacterium]